MIRLTCPSTLVEETLESLRDAGRGGTEGVVLWLARRPLAAETARKSLAEFGRLAQIIIDLDWLHDRVAVEVATEADDSPLAPRLQGAIVELCAFLRSLIAEESAEPVQAAFRGQPLLANPVPGAVQGPRDELVGADPAGLGRGDDPGRLQDPQVLDDSRERHRERLGQFADRRRTTGQPLDHGAPAGVPERMEDLVKPRILRHIPKYLRAGRPVKASPVTRA